MSARNIARQQRRGAQIDSLPLVSVIVPAWNAQDTLGDTLASVADQTYDNLEIIIVDDGSTDRTPQIARKFCTAEPRARLIRKENGGVASARNVAISEAKGEWIAPIDADDLWHPTRTAKMVAAALDAPEPVGFVYCWQRAIDERNLVIGSDKGWEYNGPAFRQFSYINAVGGGSGLLLSREAALRVSGYDETLRARHAQGCEDMMIQLRVASHFPVAVVPEYLVGWRQHGRNMSGDIEQMRRSYQLVFQTLVEEGAPIPEKVVRWTDANWHFELAQEAAIRRRPARVLKGLANAMNLDPAGSAAMLGYRFVRSILRRFRSPAHPANLNFFDVEPASQISTDPYELPRLLSLKTRLHQRRLDRLAALDGEIAASLGGARESL
jgi:glycosyltransferase involved in cell wall biosynthesis